MIRFKPHPKPRTRTGRLLRTFVLSLVKLAIALIVLSFLLVLPWRWLPVPTSSFMLQSYFGSGLSQPYRYRWISYDQISPYMPLAAIAAEDQRFPTHNGFDIEAIRSAVADYRAGEELRGGSTISQQVAKNLYLWSGRSFLRKGIEAWFTVLIEFLWTKQRILEVYLNIAQFSAHTFGVEAASEQFFDRTATEINADEAALLAAVLPGPEIYFIDQPSGTVLNAQAWILRQMDQLGLGYLQTLRK